MRTVEDFAPRTISSTTPIQSSSAGAESTEFLMTEVKKLPASGTSIGILDETDSEQDISPTIATTDTTFSSSIMDEVQYVPLVPPPSCLLEAKEVGSSPTILLDDEEVDSSPIIMLSDDDSVCPSSSSFILNLPSSKGSEATTASEYASATEEVTPEFTGVTMEDITKVMEDKPKVANDTAEDKQESAFVTIEDKPEFTSVTMEDKPEFTSVIMEDKTELMEDKPEFTGVIMEDKPEFTSVTMEDKPEFTSVTMEDKPEFTSVTMEDKTEVMEDKPEFANVTAEAKQDFACVTTMEEEFTSVIMEDKTEVMEDKPKVANVTAENKQEFACVSMEDNSEFTSVTMEDKTEVASTMEDKTEGESPFANDETDVACILQDEEIETESDNERNEGVGDRDAGGPNLAAPSGEGSWFRERQFLKSFRRIGRRLRRVFKFRTPETGTSIDISSSIMEEVKYAELVSTPNCLLDKEGSPTFIMLYNTDEDSGWSPSSSAILKLSSSEGSGATTTSDPDVHCVKINESRSKRAWRRFKRAFTCSCLRSATLH